MKLNLYNQLKLASELSEAIDSNHATHLEHRSLDAILDLISIVRELQGDSNVNPKTIDNSRASGDLFGPTLGYGRKNN